METKVNTKKPRINKAVLVMILILIYFALYYSARPDYLERLLKRNNFNSDKLVSRQKSVEELAVNLESYEKPDASGYFTDLAYEVAGSDTETRLVDTGDGKLELIATFYFTQLGKELELKNIARSWIKTFFSEAYQAPYELNNVTVIVVLSNNLNENIEVSIGRNKIEQVINELDTMSPDEFCNWVKSNEIFSETTPNAVVSKNYECF